MNIANVEQAQNTAIYVLPAITDLFMQESLCELSKVKIAQHIITIASCEVAEGVDARIGTLETMLRRCMQLHYHGDFLEKMVLEYTLKGYVEVSSIKQYLLQYRGRVQKIYPRLTVVNVQDKDIVLSPKYFNLEILI